MFTGIPGLSGDATPSDVPMSSSDQPNLIAEATFSEGTVLDIALVPTTAFGIFANQGGSQDLGCDPGAGADCAPGGSGAFITDSPDCGDQPCDNPGGITGLFVGLDAMEGPGCAPADGECDPGIPAFDLSEAVDLSDLPDFQPTEDPLFFTGKNGENFGGTPNGGWVGDQGTELTVEELREQYSDDTDLLEQVDQWIDVFEETQGLGLDITTEPLNQSQGGNYILERWQRHGRCKHQCVGSGL